MAPTSTAYVIDAVRTPVGKRNGSLAGIHPIDLGVHAFRGIFDRNDVDPAAVDDAIVGCVDAIGGQAGNIGRLTWLAAGYPEEVPGVTVDRQCGSSQQAISWGAQAIMAGTADLILAGGMQTMSQIPISSAMIVGKEFGFSTPTNESKRWLERYGDQEISQFLGAEMIAQRWDISREDMERFALASHERAFAAIRGGHFDNEIVVVDGFAVDETPRETTLEKMAGLPTLTEGGRMTAAVASQICDGSSAVLLASEQALTDHNLTPRARIHHISCRGADPVLMLTGPIPATRYALERPACRSTISTWWRSTRLSRRWYWPGLRRPRPTRRRSTPTAAPSRSAIRLARAAPNSSRPCSTNSSEPVAATDFRPCARAAAPRM